MKVRRDGETRRRDVTVRLDGVLLADDNLVVVAVIRHLLQLVHVFFIAVTGTQVEEIRHFPRLDINWLPRP